MGRALSIPRTAAEATATAESVRIGAGRSGTVYKERDSEGRVVARKVFASDSLTKLVQVIFLGAPNPYAWNEHAVQAAVLRRRILAKLVESQLGDRLRVAGAWSQDWNTDELAYQLHTEFVDGRPPALHHPKNRRGEREVAELRQVMRELQSLLEASGFDGLVWQAGRGNPVALANFLRSDAADGEAPWSWIDLESGVPALFPANPMELFRFYLPRSFAFGRPLFDDVDCDRLGAYVSEHRAGLESTLGDTSVRALERDVESLRFHDREWRSQPRVERSIGYRLKRGQVDEGQAAWYAEHPVRWYTREAVRVPGALGRKLGSLARKLREVLARVPWRKLPGMIGRFFVSQAYRWKVARTLVAGRIDSWERRRQLTPDEVAQLRDHLDSEESSAYLTDFGVHVSIKPFVKTFEWLLLPALFAAGVIGAGTLAVGVAVSGSLARTAYTFGRLLQSYATGRERPWVALGVGVLPVFGNFAYPLQVVYSSTVEDDLLAQFMLYDGCSIFGRKLPIWGGPDTLTEHAFNRLPDLLVRGR